MTTIKPHHRELVEAIASRDLTKARQLNEAMPVEDRPAYAQYLSAVFAILLEDFFGDNLSRDAISGFVKQLKDDFRNAEPPFRPLVVEGVIRASAGETDLYNDLESEDIVSTQVMIIGKLGIQGTSVRPDLENILNEAEQLVAEWAHEQ
ncbi:hypothetical protein GCM10029992_06840 [Glycomyces albus]